MNLVPRLLAGAAWVALVSLFLPVRSRAANPDFLYLTAPLAEVLGVPNGVAGSALGDLNHDGKADLVRLVGGTQAAVLLGVGDGTFGAPTLNVVGAMPNRVEIADVNNDTHPDLIVSNLNHPSLSVLLGNGNGTFQAQIVKPLTVRFVNLVVTDFNKDGWLDVVGVGYQTSPTEGYVEIVPGNGNGTFGTTTVVESSARTVVTQATTVAAADLNGDTYPDLVIGSVRNTPTLTTFLNNQNGTFTRLVEMQPPGFVGDVVLRDFNGDGKVDVAYLLVTVPGLGSSTIGESIGVALGNGDGTFGVLGFPSGTTPMNAVATYGLPGTLISSGANLVAADFDGDGVVDLATVADSATIMATYVGIFRGLGNGGFALGRRIDVASGWQRLAVGRCNGDADLDFVLSGFTRDAQPYVSGVVAPQITSAPAVSFISSRSNSFTVTATGNPAPTFTLTGTLPSGVTLSPAGGLSGVPALGSEGVYPVVITATNSFGQTTTQNLTLTVVREDLLVTTAADEDDGSANPTLGTGTSLREAVNFANTLPGPQTITFAPALAGQTISLTITGNTDQGPSALRVTGNMTIQGPSSGAGLAIARGAGGNLRLFLVAPGGSLTVNDLTLRNGLASNSGGAVNNGGTLVMNRCALHNNQAIVAGAIANGFGASSPSVTLRNCTLTANSAISGGAIFNQFPAVMTLIHVTLVGNNATVGNGIAGLRNEGTATLRSSIVAGNANLEGASDVGGTLTASSQNNLIGTGGSGGLVQGTNGNLVGVTNPRLGPLASNGGPTQTMALLPGSVAINAGATEAGITTDQRGVARLQSGTPDIGAYEYDQPLAESLVVTTATDERNFTSDPAFGTGTSLREALVYAASRPGPDTVTFSPALQGQTLLLTAGENGPTDDTALRVGTDVTIDGGAGVTLAIPTGVPRRHFINFGGTLTLRRLTLTGGDLRGVNDGGAVWSTHQVVVEECLFTNNRANYGGAIESFNSLTVRRSAFVGNQATGDGGAIHSGGGSQVQLIQNCTFTGNSAVAASVLTTAAAANVWDHLTVADNTGAGVFDVFDTTVTMRNSLVGRNTGEGALTGLGNGTGTFSATSTNNLVSGTAWTGLNPAAANLINAAPAALRLGAIAANGGPTPTIALLAGSPAINAGIAIAGLTSDQRGSLRVVAGVPDLGAYEDPLGNDDPDGDTLTNWQEVTLGADALALDTDGDGFNDATEILAGTGLASSGSVPPATRVERVLGFGPARGLDLSGQFLHAFNVGTPGAAGQAGDANFTADTAPGISVLAPFEAATWTEREFGNSGADNVLETVYRSIRWAGRADPDPERRTVRVNLANLAPGRKYKLQLLFGEGWGYNRVFDVLVNGAVIVPAFNTGLAQGINSQARAAAAVVHEFTAAGATLAIELSGAAMPPEVDANPILSGVTLESLPTVAAAPQLSPPSGTYPAPLLVSIASTAVGGTIRYTTDGSAPTALNGLTYTGPFTLGASATVRAIVTGGGWLDSAESSASYVVLSALQTWRAVHGLAADGSGDLENPARDGLPNLLKFAFNLAPNAGDLLQPNVSILPENGSAGLPRFTRDAQGRLRVEFVRLKAAVNPGISYSVVTGTDLTSLQPLDLGSAVITSIDANWERVAVTDPAVTPERFGRVLVTP